MSAYIKEKTKANTSSNIIAIIPISIEKTPSALPTFNTFFYILQFLTNTLKLLLVYDFPYI
jgi:hypothetical protein